MVRVLSPSFQRRLVLALLSLIVTACASEQGKPPTRGAVTSPARANTQLKARETEPDIAGRLATERAPVDATMGVHQARGNSRTLEIHVFAAGQANSMLIVGPEPDNKTLLVDAGEPMRGGATNHTLVYDRLQSILGGAKLDYVVLTHFHADHGGMPSFGDCNKRRGAKSTGLFSLFDQQDGPFEALTLLDPGDDDDAYIPTHNGVHCGIASEAPAWIASHHLRERRTPSIGTSDISLGDSVTVNVVAVSGRVADGDTGLMNQLAGANPNLYSDSQPASENDRSIAFFLRFGDFGMFVAGDLTGSKIGNESNLYEIRRFGANATVYTNVESYLVKHLKEAGAFSKVDIYHADHHGSGNSSNADLAGALQPEVVIYSAGTNNTYGHPSPDVVEEFCAWTSHQYVTSGVDTPVWPNGFPSRCGQVVGNDIDIIVMDEGKSYSVNGETFTATSHSDNRGLNR